MQIFLWSTDCFFFLNFFRNLRFPSIRNLLRHQVGVPFLILMFILVLNELKFRLRHQLMSMKIGLSASSFISDLTCLRIIKGTMEVRQVELIANRWCSLLEGVRVDIVLGQRGSKQDGTSKNGLIWANSQRKVAIIFS